MRIYVVQYRMFMGGYHTAPGSDRVKLVTTDQAHAERTVDHYIHEPGVEEVTLTQWESGEIVWVQRYRGQRMA